jgi:hypothetical protein
VAPPRTTVLELDNAAQNIKDSRAKPEEELAPGFQLKRIDDFSDASYPHHYAKLSSLGRGGHVVAPKTSQM